MNRYALVFYDDDCGILNYEDANDVDWAKVHEGFLTIQFNSGKVRNVNVLDARWLLVDDSGILYGWEPVEEVQ